MADADLRDYFAAKAMQAFITAGWSHPGPCNSAFEEAKKDLPPGVSAGYEAWLTRMAYRYADAMIEARQS